MTTQTNEEVDVAALVAFGRLGMELVASRVLSLVSVVGVLALSAYVAYSPSWQGAAVVALVAALVVMPCLRSERRAAHVEKT